ncbi:MAG: universal stress protein [Dehalococcoidales bacterium]
MYRRMLVTLDGSELSEVVLPYIAVLVEKMGLDVFLLHISGQEKDELMPLHRAYIERTVEIVRGRVKEAGGKGNTGSGEIGVEVKGELVPGHPAEEILRYIGKNDIDLVLMATHGHSGLKRWAMGSVAEKVIHGSRVPVWLVPARCKSEVICKIWPEAPLLVPLDGSELAEGVLDHVEALVGWGGIGPVKVVLLRVVESPVMSDHYFSNIPQTREQVDKYLNRIEARLEKAGLDVEPRVLTGEPAEQIVDYIGSRQFSLVVMSTHARSGLSRWVMGSVAMKVVSGSSTPLLLVRPS